MKECQYLEFISYCEKEAESDEITSGEIDRFYYLTCETSNNTNIELSTARTSSDDIAKLDNLLKSEKIK